MPNLLSVMKGPIFKAWLFPNCCHHDITFKYIHIHIYIHIYIYIYTYIHIYIYTYIQWRSKRSDQVNVHVACKDRQSLLMFMLLASTRDKS